MASTGANLSGPTHGGISLNIPGLRNVASRLGAETSTSITTGTGVHVYSNKERIIDEQR